MNFKEKRTIEISWAFIIFGVVLGFLVNIIANSLFDIYVNGASTKVVVLFVLVFAFTTFVIGFLSYIFENMEKFNVDDGPGRLIVTYIKSLIKK